MKGRVLGAGDVSMKSPERIPVLVDLCSGGERESNHKPETCDVS